MKITKQKVAFSLSRAKAKQKDIINKALARMGRRDKQAIVLDGPQIGTTKQLIKAGWSKHRIHIPNYSQDYKVIKKKHLNTFDKSLGEFVSGYVFDKGMVGLIYADYMCSISGNSDCKPLEDIEKIFELNLLSDGACYAITINLRNQAGSDKHFKSNDIQKMLHTLTNAASRNGYYIIIQPVGGTYTNGGTMHTCIAKVYRR